ncbi:4-carboxy-4-hydroxy-2-oxoadipate aldolase/oxaloacetate decarboxylase [Polymorphospora sp. NPDC050346]|uniref:4-carboxy-4-hydroxy-2-oxoadipate aldolase/oxaloacetate decarboxylase n=1 Tax=Polymorphospora sp. NPDC050346 TaxID=3155780 RepID=UPI0033D4E7E9
MNDPLDEQRRAILRRLGAATLYEAQGQIGAMDSGIKPVDPSSFLAGRALTVDTPPGDNLSIHHAVASARAGDVLVVDAKGYREAGAWGDVLTLAAQCAGIAGLVIDGGVRDVDSIVEMGFPAFCRAVSIKGTTKNRPGVVGAPIRCGGTPVHPGDVIIGDRDGVVVIPGDRLTAAIDAGIERERKEDGMRAALESGLLTLDLLGLR